MTFLRTSLYVPLESLECGKHDAERDLLQQLRLSTGEYEDATCATVAAC